MPGSWASAWGTCSLKSAHIHRDLILACGHTHHSRLAKADLFSATGAEPQQRRRALPPPGALAMELPQAIAGSSTLSRKLQSRWDCPAGHPGHDHCHFLLPLALRPSRHHSPTRHCQDSQLTGGRTQGTRQSPFPCPSTKASTISQQ